jgi:uncharacterized protein
MFSDILIVSAAIVAGAVAAVTGFGIGSLLTPVFFALFVDTKLAVAAVSIPHAIGTALRFWMLKGSVDRRVLWTFGLTSAAGGLAGALLQNQTDNRWLTIVFGILLLVAAAAELTGSTRWIRFRGAGAWMAGALSGLLGGLVGNQGGIRSAALLGFNLRKETFVATATAIALFVDGARVPVYVATEGHDMLAMSASIAAATGGVVAGTVLGSGALRRIPEAWFRRVLALLLVALGILMLTR